MNVRVVFKKGAKDLDDIKRDVDNAARAAYNALELVMGDAKDDTPVDTGLLRSTGTVGAPTVTGSRWSVELGFGSAAASYALIVHENLYAHHPVGKAKYLEDAITRNESMVTNRIREAIF